MMKTIDLIWLTTNPSQLPDWQVGQVLPARATVTGCADAVSQLSNENFSDYCLFWHDSLPLPDLGLLYEMTGQPGDVWHAGLRLGQSGLPHLLNFVSPVWRFNRDPAPDIVATSWRLSLLACLVKTDVLLQLGGPHPAFETLSGAALELGYRWIRNGAFVQHQPRLLPPEFNLPTNTRLSLTDEFLFIHLHHGRMWALWALMRALVTGYSSRLAAPHGWYQAVQRATPQPRRIYTATHISSSNLSDNATIPRVSVLIPTLDRYRYLFQLLEQLEEQTIRPTEIIVIDQTDLERRQTNWPEQFKHLPLRVVWQETAGQCSSRNAGLRLATGDMILFLDDDDEIPPDLIALHLSFLKQRSLDASCGVAEEEGAGSLPANFRYPRPSDVFPTNNSMLNRIALRDSGMFDLAYEKGERADGDLGMRLYLAGKTLGLNPAACVKHLHAPRGGLRQHKARAITRGGSRNTLWQRHLLAPTEGYLWSRYFSDHQVREALLIRTISTLSGRGTSLQRLLRFWLMLMLLPLTYWQNHRRLHQGQAMLAKHPTIPKLAAAEEAPCP